MATVTVGGLTAANEVGMAVGVVVTMADNSTTSGAMGILKDIIKIR